MGVMSNGFEENHGHVWFKCAPQADGHPAHYDDGQQCPYCEEEISACGVCGGLEGSLTAACPGSRLTTGDQDLIYQSTLDFREGAWVNRPLMEHEKARTPEQLAVVDVAAIRLNLDREEKAS